MKTKRIPFSVKLPGLLLFIISFVCSCGGNPDQRNTGQHFTEGQKAAAESHLEPDNTIALLVIPENPAPGKPFRIIAAGRADLKKADLKIYNQSAGFKSDSTRSGDGIPEWHVEYFSGVPAGKYNVDLILPGSSIRKIEFSISEKQSIEYYPGVWKSLRSWDSNMEILYSSWINALFSGCDENNIWKSLNEVTQNSSRNFLYGCLSLDEDNPAGRNKVIMQPDCADNPFFLRAYFSWKLGLPFGYHICNRGSLYHFPSTGEWITNDTQLKNADPIRSFNMFLRKIMDGVHSGTARTALDDQTSDYYPVSLSDSSLIPGVVYADPYGHTLVLVGHVAQKGNRSGLLLAVDAQPDGTIGIKRFWKGNFLFNTEGVIGEPGFRAFRPISLNNGKMIPLKNDDLAMRNGYTPFSLEQRNMESEKFYRSVGHIINPEPMNAESAQTELIDALYELLKTRVISVENGESYFGSHPGTVIPMPSTAAGIFQTGGLWEAYSTPNRDLRLLIAVDEVMNFPLRVIKSPDEFNIASGISAEREAEKLRSLLDKKGAELSITYRRSDGSDQVLTIKDILERRDAFEMGYNPNDGIEIRWGAPENSAERSTCRRRAPSSQHQAMLSVRHWFSKRLHPPT